MIDYYTDLVGCRLTNIRILFTDKIVVNSTEADKIVLRLQGFEFYDSVQQGNIETETWRKWE